MLKPIHAVVVFLILISSSVLAGVSSYFSAKSIAYAELNQALVRTLKMQHSYVITPDTIRQFRQNIPLESLRNESRIVVRATSGNQPKYRAECSFAAVFGLSDQRLSTVLAALALLWAAFCFYKRSRFLSPLVLTETPTRLGGLSFCPKNGNFYNQQGKPVPFTPMQQQLMALFLQSPSLQLSKTEICDALWPKKDHPDDTLYTLIRRLKPILEQSSQLRIESLRGRAYRLVSKMSE